MVTLYITLMIRARNLLLQTIYIFLKKANIMFFLRQFDIAFEGVCSLRDIEVAKEVEQINNEQIKNNMREMKRKLKVINIRFSYSFVGVISV